MRLLATLLLATVAAADPAADRAASRAMREYYGTWTGSGSITSVRDQLVPVMKQLSPKFLASVVRQINKGFEKKYKKGQEYHRCLAQILAAGGNAGISTAYRRYKGSKKRDEVRMVIAQALAECGDQRALSTLLKIVPDKVPEIAAIAVTGCAAHAKVKVKDRKATMRKLIDHYGKVTDQAAGKKAESPQMKMYRALKPAMNETLKAFSGGEALDSAEAWDAWLRENATKPWDG